MPNTPARAAPGMQYPWEIAAIVCFSVFGGLAFFALCIKAGLMMRRNFVLSRRQKAEHTLPRSVQKAMVALSGVTENRGHRSEQRECEETECPVCLASLYSAITEKTPGVDDAEAGQGVGLRGSTCTASTTSTSSTCLKGDKCPTTVWQPQPIDDEVLRMKRCRHMFHARCLATWWLQRRYDCPVCRVPYYHLPVVEPEPSREDLYYQPPTIPIMPFW